MPRPQHKFKRLDMVLAYLIDGYPAFRGIITKCLYKDNLIAYKVKVPKLKGIFLDGDHLVKEDSIKLIQRPRGNKKKRDICTTWKVVEETINYKPEEIE